MRVVDSLFIALLMTFRCVIRKTDMCVWPSDGVAVRAAPPLVLPVPGQHPGGRVRQRHRLCAGPAGHVAGTAACFALQLICAVKATASCIH